jgi:hypothetical protein
MGRWMSPDPYNGSYDASNPQSFNRYAYVLNSPLAFTDPNGQDIPDCGDEGGCDGGDGGGGGGGGGDPTGGGGAPPDPRPCIANCGGGTPPPPDPGPTPPPPPPPPDPNPFPGGCIGTCGPTTPQQPSGPTGGGGRQCIGPHCGQPAPPNDPTHPPAPAPAPPANGNRIPGFTPQDGVCTTGLLSGPMNRNPKILACCQAHDACYTQYQCNASSFDPRGPSGPCKSICNANVEACIIKAVNPFPWW